MISVRILENFKECNSCISHALWIFHLYPIFLLLSNSPIKVQEHFLGTLII